MKDKIVVTGMGYALKSAAEKLAKEGFDVVIVPEENNSSNEAKFISWFYGHKLPRIYNLALSSMRTSKDKLKEEGITSYSVLKKEYDLIQDKKSKRSKSIRNIIERVYKQLYT